MNNLLSYCGLVDARISASEKDSPVQVTSISIYYILKPLPKLGTAADDFDSWALTAGILLNKVLFFSNKRTRL